ncbi:MAG: CgeB family protein [Marinomonas sp.]|uniref:CgeB family protein n=1 Tax=Marinomonas sp. TaxID=1904862 RepID=UPI003F9CBEBE
MKILIYETELFSSGTRYPFKEAAESLGNSVDMFDWTYYFYGLNYPTFKNRIKDKLFRKQCIDNLNRDLQRIIELGNYDLFLVLSGKYIYPETTEKAIKKIKCVVNWNTDHPFNMLNSTKWLLDSLPLYHAHFTPRIHLKDDYEQFGMKNIHELNWYYRYGIDLIEKKPKEYTYESNFIGSWSKRRSDYINSIPDSTMQIFGWGWNRKDDKVDKSRINPSISIKKMMDIYSFSKINLNLLTIENKDTTNLRNFEIPAAYGFQLAERSDALKNIFEEDKEIVLFSSPEEMADKYQYYLNNDVAREKISLAGFSRLKNSQHSLADRLNTIFNTMGL